MVAISITLFIFEIIALFGTIINDVQNNQAIGTGLLSMFPRPNSVMDFVALIGELIGYFLPTIIGIILLFIAHKRKMKQNGIYKEREKRSLFGLIVSIQYGYMLSNSNC